MTITRIAWDSGLWTAPPVSISSDNGSLVVEAAEGSDFWEKTLYGFQHDNGHALLAPWSGADAVEVSFSTAGFTELYDQAGLMLWNGPAGWIKAGVEVSDGVLHLGAVVTDGFSDWSLAPVPEWRDRIVTVRVSQMNDAVILRARADGESWRTLRVAPFPRSVDTQAGPFLCAPTRAGLRVRFTAWTLTPPDIDLHAEPLAP